MTSTLPPDPYKLLGVTKDAKLPEIRSAHRKLVLKCHPDKVQDAALKAIKVDEFQKVQQAYELLSDDARRSQYDNEVKLYELRKEMGKGNPTARSNPFEYEVKTAEPRPNSYSRAQPSPKVYGGYSEGPRSREEVNHETRHKAQKSTSFEDSDRKRRSQREEEIRVREAYLRAEEAKLREKEAKRSAHKSEKKSRDKERKKDTDAKASKTRATYVEDDSSDDYAKAPRSSEKKSSRHRSMEEDIRQRNEDASRAEEARRAHTRSQRPAAPPAAPLDPKWSAHMEAAGAYMQAARSKAVPAPMEVPHAPHVPHPGLRRSETMPTHVQYTSIPPRVFSDEDSPKRSSAPRRESRRTSDTPTKETSTRKRSKDRGERKSSPSHREPSIQVVEPPSPSTRKPPTFHKSDSAPPKVYEERKQPSRSQTEYSSRSHAEPVPSMSRAQTFSHSKERSSKLRQEVSSESDSDEPQHTAPPRREPQQTRYVVENGRVAPAPPAANTSRHRSDLHGLNESYPRERSQSPHGTPATAYHRPAMPSIRSSERIRSTSRHANGTQYYHVEPPLEPIVVAARPKPTRESSRSNYKASGGPFEKVSYTPAYTTDNVKYATYGGSYGGGRRREEDDYGRAAYAVS